VKVGGPLTWKCSHAIGVISMDLFFQLVGAETGPLTMTAGSLTEPIGSGSVQVWFSPNPVGSGSDSGLGLLSILSVLVYQSIYIAKHCIYCEAPYIHLGIP